MLIEQRLDAMGLYLPAPTQVPPEMVIAFEWVRVFEGRAYVAGHSAQAPDGQVVGPFGKVGRLGSEVSPKEAAVGARLATLSMLGSLKRAIGDLDRITAWLHIEAYVLAEPGFEHMTNVINGCSELILGLFGPEVGGHSRTATGVAATPLSCSVVLAAQVAIRD
ncbi:MAG: RidA family protein [Polaromonas sp.]|nr:RidA family protein [Polaromonas sp.]